MPTPFTHAKRLIFGRPLASERLEHERLSKKTALAVLSSDAISSVASATAQILFVLAVLVAAAALLTDYILTVAVSISGGVAAITSAYPSLAPHTVTLGVLSIALLMIVNLRGVRESGAAFSVPTYLFVAMMLALLGAGLFRLATGHELAPLAGTIKVDPVSARHYGGGLSPITGFALFYLLLRGFAEGCAAMTGTEAISNGVMAFRQPAP